MRLRFIGLRLCRDTTMQGANIIFNSTDSVTSVDETGRPMKQHYASVHAPIVPRPRAGCIDVFNRQIHWQMQCRYDTFTLIPIQINQVQ